VGLPSGKSARKRDGFLTTGLFAYSRHPNFFFEQAQWWAFYAFGATAAVASGGGVWGGVINPTIVGAILLTLLFVGSTVFTESISAAKYPAYAQYRRTTSMLVPLPRRRDGRASAEPAARLAQVALRAHRLVGDLLVRQLVDGDLVAVEDEPTTDQSRVEQRLAPAATDGLQLFEAVGELQKPGRAGKARVWKSVRMPYARAGMPSSTTIRSRSSTWAG
jgi:hypothetical protein